MRRGVALAAVLLAGGCSSFGAEGSSSGAGPAEGGAPDAAPADAGGSSDAKAGGPDVCRTRAWTFCETFDDGTLASPTDLASHGWQIEPDMSPFSFVAGDQSPRALRASGTAASRITHVVPLSASFHIHAVLDVFLADGTSRAELLSVDFHSPAGYVNGFSLQRQTDETLAVVFESTGATIPSATGLLLRVGRWVPIEIDATQSAIHVVVDGAPADLGRGVTPGADTQTVFFLIGVSPIPTSTPTTLTFDDVAAVIE